MATLPFYVIFFSISSYKMTEPWHNESSRFHADPIRPPKTYLVIIASCDVLFTIYESTVCFVAYAFILHCRSSSHAMLSLSPLYFSLCQCNFFQSLRSAPAEGCILKNCRYLHRQLCTRCSSYSVCIHVADRV